MPIQNVVNAGQKQMATLLHAMGDVHPHALKAQLARELSFHHIMSGGGKSLSSATNSTIQRFNGSR